MLNNLKQNLEEIKNNVKALAQELEKANKLLVNALSSCDKKTFDESKLYIKNVTNKAAEIDQEIVTTLALHQPEAKDLRTMVSCLKITNELIRASSNTRNFIKGFQKVCEGVDLQTINEYAIPMQKFTVEALQCIVKMFDINCEDEMQECYNSVLICENKTDDLYEMIEASLIQQAKENDNFSKYHQMLSSLRRSEKIADRAMSIASLLLYANNGGVLHQV